MPPLGPFIGEFPDTDAGWLAQNGSRTEVAAGEALLREGHSADAIFVVLEGVFSVTSVELAGLDLPLLGVGEIAGGLAYVRRKAPRVTVTAVGDGAVLRVPFELLDARARGDAGFASRLRERARDAEDMVRRDTQGSRRSGRSPAPRPSEPRESVENMRISELIERMLRGDIGDR